MLGIVASLIRTSTRTERAPETDFEKIRRIRDPRHAERRCWQEALDRETRFRRGYW